MTKRHTTATLFALCCVISVWFTAATDAFAIPGGRHYEMISQPYKAGYGVNSIEAAAPVSSGTADSVAYTSVGSFAGAPSNNIGKGNGGAYIAMRGPSDWVTYPAMLPATLAPYIAPAIDDFSSTFEQDLFYGQRGNSSGDGQFESTEAEFLLHPVATTDFLSNFAVAGRVIGITPARNLNYSGASPDLSHIIVEVPQQGMPLTKEAEGTTMERSQYDLAVHSTGEHNLHLLGVDNKPEPESIAPNCNVQLGSVLVRGGTNETAFHAVSSGGEEIFFHTCAGPSSVSEPLFVRLNGERTLEVSRPLGTSCLEVPCEGAATRPSADFVGASEDGSRVFFTTTAHLVGEYEGSTPDLYVATIGCPALEPECGVARREVTGLQRVGSLTTPSKSVDVQGVVAVSSDASRVYFVAKAVLVGPGPNGAPLQGADNLYMYDASSQSTAFVGNLCSENGRSGDVADSRCPLDLDRRHGVRPVASDEELWSNPHPEAQVTSDGTFFVFSSYARLTTDDSDNARDVYRYDAATETIQRVSVGVGGYLSNGNEEDEAEMENADASVPSFPAVSEGRVASQAKLATRAITEDGSRIVFSTAEPLSGAASNGLLNAYEWNEGAVSLVSSGNDEQPVGQSERLTITPSGEDIFFITVQKLLKQDTDEALDVYDARTGPEPPPPPGSTEGYCAEEECQGPLSALLPAWTPSGTAVQVPGENRAIGKGKAATGNKKKHKHKTRRHRKRRRRAAKSSRGGRR